MVKECEKMAISNENIKNIIFDLNNWFECHGFAVESVYNTCHGTSLQEQIYYLMGVCKEICEKTSEVVGMSNKLEKDFTELKTFVDEYFNNLDVQEQINNKLDEMVTSGALKEIISEYFNSFVSPATFGAKGDGVTDDTVALNKMLTFCKSKAKVREFEGEESCFDWTYVNMLFNGKYLISSPLIFTNTYGVKLDGLNIVSSDTFSGDSLIMFNGGTRNACLTNCNLDGALQANSCVRVDDYYVSIHVSNVNIHHFKKVGVNLQGKGHEVELSNVKINQVEWGEYKQINTVLSEGVGVYVSAVSNDHNFTNTVINYCKDSCLKIDGGAVSVVNCHFYGGDVVNNGTRNAFSSCYFDGANLKTKGFFFVDNCVFHHSGEDVTPFIHLTDTKENVWKYESSSITNCKFTASKQTAKCVELGLQDNLPRMTAIGNSFYYVTPFNTRSTANSPNPWELPTYTIGNTESGCFIQNELVFAWGTANADGFCEYPSGVTIPIIFNFVLQRLDNGSTRDVFPNTIQNNKFYLNGTDGHSVKWLVIGRGSKK